MTTINIQTTNMKNDLQTMSPPQHLRLSLNANVAEGGDTKDHFVNGPNTLWPTLVSTVSAS
jgi:hypothetical protein